MSSKPMKTIFLFIALISINDVFGQKHQVQKLWETQAIFKVPESVLYYQKENYLFVSNIDGKSDKKDGMGFISKLDPDGKIINMEWVTGLNAPKGMGIFENKLYVADLDEVVVIDILSGKIIQHIQVDSAIFLNDITIDKKGTVYVSDTRNFKVHCISHGNVTTFLSGLKGPNGLLAVNDYLYVLDRGSLLKADASGTVKVIAEGMDKSTDGLEIVNSKEFIISCWNGITYYLTNDGDKEVMFDKRDFKINSADIGYDAKRKIIYVPTFNNNKVIAYKIKPIIRM
jgi:DNA-binding beta-propeller fold protein YncE